MKFSRSSLITITSMPCHSAQQAAHTRSRISAPTEPGTGGAASAGASRPQRLQWTVSLIVPPPEE
jgi:hypothetical protein